MPFVGNQCQRRGAGTGREVGRPCAPGVDHALRHHGAGAGLDAPRTVAGDRGHLDAAGDRDTRSRAIGEVEGEQPVRVEHPVAGVASAASKDRSPRPRARARTAAAGTNRAPTSRRAAGAKAARVAEQQRAAALEADLSARAGIGASARGGSWRHPPARPTAAPSGRCGPRPWAPARGARSSSSTDGAVPDAADRRPRGGRRAPHPRAAHHTASAPAPSRYVTRAASEARGGGATPTAPSCR